MASGLIKLMCRVFLDFERERANESDIFLEIKLDRYSGENYRLSSVFVPYKRTALFQNTIIYAEDFN